MSKPAAVATVASIRPSVEPASEPTAKRGPGRPPKPAKVSIALPDDAAEYVRSRATKLGITVATYLDRVLGDDFITIEIVRSAHTRYLETLAE
jgi:hypothetical protein